MKNYKSLREKEEGLCKRLNLPPHDTSIGEVPTTVQVKEIEANIDYMERELVCIDARVEPGVAKQNYSGPCFKPTYLIVHKEPGLKIQSFSNT